MQRENDVVEVGRGCKGSFRRILEEEMTGKSSLSRSGEVELRICQEVQVLELIAVESILRVNRGGGA